MPHTLICIQHNTYNVHNLLMACNAPSLQSEIAHCDTESYEICGARVLLLAASAQTWQEKVSPGINWWPIILIDIPPTRPRNSRKTRHRGIINFLLRAGWRCFFTASAWNQSMTLELYACREKTAAPLDHLVAQTVLWISILCNRLDERHYSEWKCHDFDRWWLLGRHHQKI